MTYKYAAVALALVAPTWVQALDLREPPLQAMTLQPTGAPDTGGARQATRLRDALRQAPSDSESGKPFRLSAEERQRLREQLRSQTVQAGRDK